MLKICVYYAGIMLNVFATYYAHNYAGIVGSSLVACTVWRETLVGGNVGEFGEGQ